MWLREKLYMYNQDIINELYIFYICVSMHHQSVSLGNQRDAALSSRIYDSLRGYSTSNLAMT
jgi:hypothetical protein